MCPPLLQLDSGCCLLLPSVHLALASTTSVCLLVSATEAASSVSGVIPNNPLHRISQTLDLSVSPSFLANRYRISLPLFPFIYIFLQRISYLFALSLSIRRVWVLQCNLCANTNELQPWVNLSRNEGLQIHFCAVSLMYCECSFL